MYGGLPGVVVLVNMTDWPTSIAFDAGFSKIARTPLTVTVFAALQTDVAPAWDESTELKEYSVDDEGLTRMDEPEPIELPIHDASENQFICRAVFLLLLILLLVWSIVQGRLPCSIL